MSKFRSFAAMPWQAQLILIVLGIERKYEENRPSTNAGHRFALFEHWAFNHDALGTIQKLMRSGHITVNKEGISEMDAKRLGWVDNATFYPGDMLLHIGAAISKADASPEDVRSVLENAEDHLASMDSAMRETIMQTLKLGVRAEQFVCVDENADMSDQLMQIMKPILDMIDDPVLLAKLRLEAEQTLKAELPDSDEAKAVPNTGIPAAKLRDILDKPDIGVFGMLNALDKGKDEEEKGG